MEKDSKINLLHTPILSPSKVFVTGSKSESNRALILQALSQENAIIQNLSHARDTRTMQTLLASNEVVLNVLDAGTTMRFLTAYFAIGGQKKILTGTDRMKERPIKILVDALLEIGADISYLEKDGFPPIEIKGLGDQRTDTIEIRGDVSSQYISALLMISPTLSKGLKLQLLGTIGSKPYIQMTLDIMEKFELEYSWDREKNIISIPNQNFRPRTISIEPDWSGASYWYAFIALADKATISIPGLKKQSFQGDHIISEFGEQLGVTTKFSSNGVELQKINCKDQVEFDFTDCPDLAQTVAVICSAKNIKGKFSGLKSLRIKETDRIQALQNELAKLNAELIQTDEDEYHLIPSKNIPQSANFTTYDDHRMAMAFAPLCTKMNLSIDDPVVVDKSYPSYWKEIKKLGVRTEVI